MSDLTRDEHHVYRYRGKIVPGVTRIMDHTLRDLSTIAKAVLENAREIGTLVHDATELDVKDELDPDSVDPSIKPYMRAWHQFRLEVKPVFLSSEEMVYHHTYGYAGTLDHRTVINGEEGILDKKTGIPDKSDAVQLSAYKHAKFHDSEILQRTQKGWILSLRNDGTYRLREYKDYFHIFLAALTCHRFINEGWK